MAAFRGKLDRIALCVYGLLGLKVSSDGFERYAHSNGFTVRNPTLDAAAVVCCRTDAPVFLDEAVVML